MTERPPPSDEALTQALGPAASLFRGTYTLLVRTCYDHGLVPSLGKHLEQVYFHAKHIRDPRVIESLLSIALHHCENQYCYTLHSTWLLGMQVHFDQIAGLLELLEAPEGITDRKKWSMVIRCTYFAFLDDSTFATNMSLVRRFLAPEEYQDYVHILALVGFLRTVLLCFPEQIDLHREPLLTGYGLSEQTHRILALSKARLATQANRHHELVSLCMYCKDLRTENDRWVPIETCLDELSPNTYFSHGICPKCYQKEFGDIVSD
ncbi:MAG: hypothetical protein AAGF11_04375 [Myxococcota bacterium]